MMTLSEKLLVSTKQEEITSGFVEFVSSAPMTITPIYTNSGVTLQYSLDCITWINITSKVQTPSANIIYFRGKATGTKSLYSSMGQGQAWTFTGATNLECNGKLDRLLQNTLGEDTDILKLGNYGFSCMFYNINTLIKAPELPATTVATNCYNEMFRGCTSLKTTPKLPATTLATSCYYNMFYGCTSLTTAPELPATTLTDSCYYNMFYGCTSLKISETLTGIYDTAYRIPKTGTGIIANSSLFNMFSATGGTFKSNPTINTTYYTENTPA